MPEASSPSTQPKTEVLDSVASLNGEASLEAVLRHLCAERTRWRELRDQAQEEFNRLNREVLRVQEAYCTDEAHDREYRRCVERLTGWDPYISPEEIAEAQRTGGTIDDILAALGTDTQ